MTNDPDGDTFGDSLSGPDTAPPYAAFYGDDATWGILSHRDGGKTIVNGLTEAQALTIATYFNGAFGLNPVKR